MKHNLTMKPKVVILILFIIALVEAVTAKVDVYHEQRIENGMEVKRWYNYEVIEEEEQHQQQKFNEKLDDGFQIHIIGYVLRGTSFSNNCSDDTVSIFSVKEKKFGIEWFDGENSDCFGKADPLKPRILFRKAYNCEDQLDLNITEIQLDYHFGGDPDQNRQCSAGEVPNADDLLCHGSVSSIHPRIPFAICEPGQICTTNITEHWYPLDDPATVNGIDVEVKIESQAVCRTLQGTTAPTSDDEFPVASLSLIALVISLLCAAQYLYYPLD